MSTKKLVHHRWFLFDVMMLSGYGDDSGETGKLPICCEGLGSGVCNCGHHEIDLKRPCSEFDKDAVGIDLKVYERDKSMNKS